MTRSAVTPLLLRRTAILALCLAASLAEAKPVPVYVVDVAGETPAALQDGMRMVLVRSTGHREAASAPALAGLISAAGNYVKGYGKGPQGQTQVSFDGPGIERAIRAAGLEVWPADRPYTLVTLAPPPPRTTEDSMRSELEKEAARRGLAITMVPITNVDPSGKGMASDALLQSAKRYGADQVLIGHQDGGQWRWTLYGGKPHPSFSGSLTAGIDGAVDMLVPSLGDTVATSSGAGSVGGAMVATATTSAAAAAAAAAGGPETLTRIQVQGISGLADYAQVERLLESVPGVRRARMYEAQGTQAIFEVAVRGGADTLDRGLAGSSKLARSAATGGALVYLYHP